jgi:hypothetical protein
MSRRVHQDDLVLMHEFVSLTLRKGWDRNDRNRTAGRPQEVIWVTVDAAKLSPLLDELIKRRPNPESAKRLGLTTKTLMRMEVGEVLDFPPISQVALSTARKTAKKHMGNPDAYWHGVTQPNGFVQVTRMPDGTPKMHGLPKSPIIAKLAAMNKNGRIVVPASEAPRLPQRVKAQARAALDFAGADWRREPLANGDVRIVRIK